ncbi:MAG: hypothetical protein J1F43_06570 [Muribaculaceae bacterium]|nr:hypothetical protein [Muribaculaceae bacterium]
MEENTLAFDRIFEDIELPDSIIKLIRLSIKDGDISHNERSVIIKKAIEEKVDIDLLNFYLEKIEEDLLSKEDSSSFLTPSKEELMGQSRSKEHPIETAYEDASHKEVIQPHLKESNSPQKPVNPKKRKSESRSMEANREIKEDLEDLDSPGLQKVEISLPNFRSLYSVSTLNWLPNFFSSFSGITLWLTIASVVAFLIGWYYLGVWGGLGVGLGVWVAAYVGILLFTTVIGWLILGSAAVFGISYYFLGFWWATAIVAGGWLIGFLVSMLADWLNDVWESIKEFSWIIIGIIGLVLLGVGINYLAGLSILSWIKNLFE